MFIRFILNKEPLDLDRDGNARLDSLDVAVKALHDKNQGQDKEDALVQKKFQGIEREV